MKTVKSNGAVKAVKVNGSRNGKTPAQISAHEYRNELHYLKFIMKKTNMAPAEIAARLNEVATPPIGVQIRKAFAMFPDEITWSDAVPLRMDVALPFSDWSEIMGIAQDGGWSLEEAVSELLIFGLEYWQLKQHREETMKEHHAKAKAGKV